MKTHDTFFRKLLCSNFRNMSIQDFLPRSFLAEKRQSSILESGEEDFECSKVFRKSRKLSRQSPYQRKDGQAHGDSRTDVPFVLSQEDIIAFESVLASPNVAEFLRKDTCFMKADRYLLCVVLIYCKRSRLEFTERNFWLLLYIAHEIFEEKSELRRNLLPWALGDQFLKASVQFFEDKTNLVVRLRWKLNVSSAQMEQVLDVVKCEALQHRVRRVDHGGCWKEDTRMYFRNEKPAPCEMCEKSTAITLFE
eukprot:TRINITY_DN12187_c0_g1_i4.p1 TRINITY_DN12187_c0_g1~~TRINITY_DN12187_c0_g1_i4.p1  ORF type:complete len:251 (+),score=27.46 TRINITY_DN12187_c0_g1_i4:33-785(+)